MSSRVVGIDIGTSAVRAVEVKDAATASPVVLRYHEVPLPFGAVDRGEVLNPEVVGASLKRLWSEGGFTSKDVVLGMANHRLVVRNLTVPKMSLRRIRESLPFQVQDLIAFPPHDALLDFYPISEVPRTGDVGPQIAGLLIAVLTDVVVASVTAARHAGLSPANVDLMSFARSRALHHGNATTDVVAQIDVGAGATSILISAAGVPQFVRTIPAGGHQVTKALRMRLGLSEERAEAVKRKVGLGTSVEPAPEDREAVAIIRNVTSELLEGIRNTVSYHNDSDTREPVSRISLTGAAARLDGFSAALSDTVRLPVANPQSLGGVELGAGLTKEVVSRTLCTYLGAVGLTLGSRV